ncbi:MAG: hypothetical protein K1X65_04640 [Caldilineales bacterium]|nr:hypothetical protein [Caldilineales bacterium]
MTTPPSTPPKEGTWAKPVDRLQVGDISGEAVNLNVQGRQLAGPLKGFGQLWQKTYKIRLAGAQATPQEVIARWRANFPAYWPEGNHLYASSAGIAPGEVGVLNLKGPGGMLLSTGILVIYADDASFSFMTPEGHMFAGMITFSAQAEEEATTAQVQALVRANDPMYEMSFRLGFGHKAEDKFWADTLVNLAQDFGVSGVAVEQKVTLVDSRVQWGQAGNIWHNAAIRTTLKAPVRAIKGVLRR